MTIALDAAQQSEVKTGDRVTITLPGGHTTPGVVSSVGKVASSSSGGTPTVTVLARPGGYAVDEVTASGRHHLVPVTPGLFDDNAGLVQVSAPGLAAGQRVVVPAL